SLVARKVQNGQKLVVGFDCEWEVSFSKRIHKKVALIQICTSEKDCYLFHLSKMNFMPESLRSLISSDSLLKVGANINSDLYRLHRDYNVRSDTIVTGIRASTIDLCEFANTKFSMKQKWSLSTLCEFFLNKQLTKSETERFSKWSSSNLTLLQIKYASTDAYVNI
ncbi:Werner syndrome ATP-dependent helicase-like isoform X2, partial [Leptotrombidium deliense]